MSTLLSAAVWLCLVVAACGGAPSSSELSGGTADQSSTDVAALAAPDASADRSAEAKLAADSPAAPEAPPKPVQRMVVYNGSLRLRVAQLDTAGNRIRALVQRYGGYVGSEQLSDGGSYRELSITVRVPAVHFHQLVRDAEGIAQHVEGKQLQAEDVTQEYADNNARIRSKKAAEEQYYAILRRATKISEILEVQDKLRVIREEIEVLEGRQRYLANQSAFSTLTVTLFVTQSFAPPVQDSFGYRLGIALESGWAFLLNLLVGLVYLWPLWLLLGLGVGLYRWRFRNRRFGQPAAQPAPTEAPPPPPPPAPQPPPPPSGKKHKD